MAQKLYIMRDLFHCMEFQMYLSQVPLAALVILLTCDVPVFPAN